MWRYLPKLSSVSSTFGMLRPILVFPKKFCRKAAYQPIVRKTFFKWVRNRNPAQHDTFISLYYKLFCQCLRLVLFYCYEKLHKLKFLYFWHPQTAWFECHRCLALQTRLFIKNTSLKTKFGRLIVFAPFLIKSPKQRLETYCFCSVSYYYY
jgi:hypothetical protein